jgi:hypothetical protein
MNETVDSVFGELMAMVREYRDTEEMVLLIRPEVFSEMMAKTVTQSTHFLMTSIDSIMGYEYRVTHLIDEPYRFVPKKDLIPPPTFVPNWK